MIAAEKNLTAARTMTSRELHLEPRRPKSMSNYSELCLQTLGARGLGTRFSIGGAVGLAYYHEYRPTHDLDAWWNESAGSKDREAVVTCLQETLGELGQVRTRSWGDVVSVDLLQGKEAVFSFQIASRDAQLDPSVPAPWPPNILLDSFRDIVASKMKALVERGAPRDFRDIHALYNAGIIDAETCWGLWSERIRRGGGDASTSRARLAVQSHLVRIELHRPLERIEDAAAREGARALREWFRREFLDALVD
jgi:hypothetical protein